MAVEMAAYQPRSSFSFGAIMLLRMVWSPNDVKQEIQKTSNYKKQQHAQ